MGAHARVPGRCRFSSEDCTRERKIEGGVGVKKEQSATVAGLARGFAGSRAVNAVYEVHSLFRSLLSFKFFFSYFLLFFIRFSNKRTRARRFVPRQGTRELG